MPRGDKSAYTARQKRMAEHIEESYEERGVGVNEAESRAWATVNKYTGGGQKSGSGRKDAQSHSSSEHRNASDGHSRSHQERSAAAKKGWETRRRKAAAK